MSGVQIATFCIAFESIKHGFADKKKYKLNCQKLKGFIPPNSEYVNLECSICCIEIFHFYLFRMMILIMSF